MQGENEDVMSEQETILAFFLGGQELVLIAVAALLLLFGGKRIPELARSVGRSIVEFKAGLKDTGEKAEKTPEGEAKSSDQQPQ